MIDPIALSDVEMEKAVLGALLSDASLYSELGLSPADFFVQRHRWIWNAFTSLREQGQPADFLTVTTYLDQMGKLTETGGPAYLASLLGDLPNVYHAPAYAQTLRDLSNRRKLRELSSVLFKAASETEKPFMDVLPEIGDKLVQFSSGTKGSAVHIGVWADATYQYILAKQGQTQQNLLTTDFVDFNAVFGGFDPSEGTMLLLGGKPGAGKTILFTNIALQLQRQAPGVLYSLEMKSRRMMYRVFSMETGLSSWVMRGQRLSNADLQALEQACQHLKQTHLYVSDHANLTTQALAADLFRLKHEYGIKWFGVDYLGLLADDTGKVEGWEREAILSRRLLRLNRQLGLASMIIHTLNKDGKFSGAAGIQYDTDTAVILEDGNTPGSGAMEVKKLTFVKNRDGEMPLGEINLMKHAKIPKFENAATRHIDLNGNGKNGYTNGHHKGDRQLMEFSR